MRRRGAGSVTAKAGGSAVWAYSIGDLRGEDNRGMCRDGTGTHRGRWRVVVRVVQLGSPRAAGEGTRIGTVRRPPRGVAKARFAADDWYDVWYPNLAPSADTVKLGLGAESDAAWNAFVRKYRSEMKLPENDRTLDLLAALSHQAHFSVGCYCENEARCHRSVLRELLAEKGAAMAPAP